MAILNCSFALMPSCLCMQKLHVGNISLCELRPDAEVFDYVNVLEGAVSQAIFFYYRIRKLNQKPR